MWPAVDHETTQSTPAANKKFRRLVAVTPQCRWWHTQLARNYSDYSTRCIKWNFFSHGVKMRFCWCFRMECFTHQCCLVEAAWHRRLQPLRMKNMTVPATWAGPAHLWVVLPLLSSLSSLSLDYGCVKYGSGAQFSKNLTLNLWKTCEKVCLMKNLGWGCHFQKKNLTKILWRT